MESFLIKGNYRSTTLVCTPFGTTGDVASFAWVEIKLFFIQKTKYKSNLIHPLSLPLSLSHTHTSIYQFHFFASLYLNSLFQPITSSPPLPTSPIALPPPLQTTLHSHRILPSLCFVTIVGLKFAVLIVYVVVSIECEFYLEFVLQFLV